MARRDVPDSVRIRTDDGNEWRYDAIQAAADYYDCDRSDAVAYACEDMTGAVESNRLEAFYQTARRWQGECRSLRNSIREPVLSDPLPGEK